MRAPAAGERANDDQVAFNHGAVGPSAVAGDPAQFLTEAVLPDDLAVLVEAKHEALNAVCVNVAGFGVDCQIGPAEAVGDDVS